MEKLQNSKYEDIIVDIITKNERYQGNEDLLKFIYDDVLERLGTIVDTINDETIIRSYIERIAKLSIITIVKKRNLLVSKEAAKPQAEVKKSVAPRKNPYEMFNYTPEFVEEKITLGAEKLAHIESGIMDLNKDYPVKEFIKLYNLRYKENKSLEEISDELNVSQAQAAERLFDLTALVKRICGNEVSQV